MLRRLLLAATLSTAAIWPAVHWADQKAAAAIDAYLRAQVFPASSEATFDRVDANVLLGAYSVERVRVGPAQVSAIVARVPVLDAVAGDFKPKRIDLVRPQLEIETGLDEAASTGAVAALPISTGPVTLAALLAQVPAPEIRVKKGRVVFMNRTNGRSIQVDAVGGRFYPNKASIELEGLILGDRRTGTVSLSARLDAPFDKLNGEGELRIKDLSIPYVAAAFLPAEPELKPVDGLFDLKTQWSLKNDWLTASHLVEVRRLKLKVAPGEDQVLGIKVSLLKDILDLEYLSFVVPMNGSVYDPHIGVATSVEQSLYKLLEGKMSNRDKLESWARFGGRYIGGKLDRAVRRWLAKK